MTTSARLELAGLGDDVTMRISSLEGEEHAYGVPRLLDLSNDPTASPSAEAIQLLEESEYRYAIENLPDDVSVSVEPRELFSYDETTGTSGRIRTGRSVGRVALSVEGEDGRLGLAAFEIRSRKLGYLDDFRWMLEGISSRAADVILSEFAPSGVRLDVDWSNASKSLYPRFALLWSLVGGPEFEAAIASILRNPHTEYRQIAVSVDPSFGVRGGSSLSQELSRPGPRTSVSTSLGLPIDSIPVRLSRIEHLETRDTAPNRFIKYALESWLRLADDVAAALERTSEAAARRGAREVAEMRRVLDHTLAARLFEDVGVLDSLPSASQVLQRRAGYREILRLFLQVEAAAALDWSPDEDVFPAGSKDVATLYEYWTYLELARVIETLGFSIDWSDLIEVSSSGLVLNLAQGRTPVLVGSGFVRGRSMRTELYYNRTFKRGAGAWTRDVRPDCSLRFTFSDPLSGEPDVWLHFDAKYRIRGLVEAIGSDVESEATPNTSALTDDLLKMHTYRDAILRTAGSYVLYPGTSADPGKGLFERYHEVLPGLGAFALHPATGGGAASGQLDALAAFLSGVIEHMAARGTSMERSDYWNVRSYAEKRRPVTPTDALTMPAADTLVLVGYARDQEHLDWIHANRLYNLRADDRPGAVDLSSDMLRATFLVVYSLDPQIAQLYRIEPGIQIRTSDELRELGYRQPGGKRYACLQLGQDLRDPGIDASDVATVARRVVGDGLAGAPVLMAWSDLFALEGAV